MATWVKVKTRLQHNHVLQSENGVPDCPACESIDPYHMTEDYFHLNYYAMTRGRHDWDDD